MLMAGCATLDRVEETRQKADTVLGQVSEFMGGAGSAAQGTGRVLSPFFPTVGLPLEAIGTGLLGLAAWIHQKRQTTKALYTTPPDAVTTPQRGSGAKRAETAMPNPLAISAARIATAETRRKAA